MSKIIKYTFKIPNVIVENGELVQKGEKEETYFFTFLFKGLGIFEEISNEPLIDNLVDLIKLDESAQIKKVMNSKFLLDLASASYVKIENNRYHNNRSTCEDFRKSSIVNHLNDIDFIVELLHMAIECLIGKDIKPSDKNNKKEIKEELEETKN